VVGQILLDIFANFALAAGLSPALTVPFYAENLVRAAGLPPGSGALWIFPPPPSRAEILTGRLIDRINLLPQN
jgi:hypothetical protein